MVSRSRTVTQLSAGVFSSPTVWKSTVMHKYFMVDFDDAGSIGKRYRREDEIGTPLCITVDFQTVGDAETPADDCVTVRDRDTMEQVRVSISELKSWLEEKLAY